MDSKLIYQCTGWPHRPAENTTWFVFVLPAVTTQRNRHPLRSPPHLFVTITSSPCLIVQPFFFFCSWASFIPHYSSTFSTNLMPCNDCQYLASPHSLDPAIPGCIIFSQLWAKCTLVIVGLPECPMLNKKPTCSSVYTHICFCRLARPIVRESIPVTRVAIVRPIRSALRIRRRSRLFPPISAWTTSTTLCCILSPLSKSCSRLFLGPPP